MPGRLPRVTAKEIIRALERAGWTRLRSRGSHARFAHPDRTEQVTIPAHSGEIIGPDLLKLILRQAGLTAADFERSLHG